MSTYRCPSNTPGHFWCVRRYSLLHVARCSFPFLPSCSCTLYRERTRTVLPHPVVLSSLSLPTSTNLKARHLLSSQSSHCRSRCGTGSKVLVCSSEAKRNLPAKQPITWPGVIIAISISACRYFDVHNIARSKYN